MKVFGIDRHSALGLSGDDPSYPGAGFASDAHSGTYVASWKTTNAGRQGITVATWTVSDVVAMHGGAEAEQRRSRFAGQAFDDAVAGTRVRVVTGLRGDRSTLTDRTTADPRVSAALQLLPNAMTAAWGIYHQVPAPIDFRAGVWRPVVATDACAPDSSRRTARRGRSARARGIV